MAKEEKTEDAKTAKEIESKDESKTETKKEAKVESKKPDWVKVKPAELEKLVSDLAKKGETLAKIGLILRDQHGIPKSKLLGRRISEIISSAKIEMKTEKDALKTKIEKLNKHIEKHKHDSSASRSLTKKLWAIQKL